MALLFPCSQTATSGLPAVSDLVLTDLWRAVFQREDWGDRGKRMHELRGPKAVPQRRWLS